MSRLQTARRRFHLNVSRLFCYLTNTMQSPVNALLEAARIDVGLSPSLQLGSPFPIPIIRPTPVSRKSILVRVPQTHSLEGGRN